MEKNLERFDLVHIHGPFSHACLAASRAARRMGKPYVIRTLGNLDPWSLRQHQIRKAVFFRIALKRVLLEAAAMHYTSEWERERTERRLELNRGVVIPLGVDDLAFDYTKAPEELSRQLSFLGRIARKKRLELLIDGFRAISERGTSWKMTIAGDGDAEYVSELKRRAEGLDVEWVGWLSGAEKYKLLAKSSLFALPSENENFGIAVAEALAVGVPVVVSERVALARDITRQDEGWSVPEEAGWAEALAHAFGRLERDHAEWSRRAAKLGTSFRWNRVAEQVMAMYERILSIHRETRG